MVSGSDSNIYTTDYIIKDFNKSATDYPGRVVHHHDYGVDLNKSKMMPTDYDNFLSDITSKKKARKGHKIRKNWEPIIFKKEAK